MLIINDQRGQSFSEYIIIIVLVVIAVIVSFHLFGSTVRDKFFRAGDNVKQSSVDSAETTSSAPGSSGPAGSGTQPGQREYGKSSADDEYISKIFADEEALKLYEEEKRKAWFKTVIVFAVAGAVLLMLVFMTIERIRLIKKQMQLQQDEADDFRRTRYRKPITFTKKDK